MTTPEIRAFPLDMTLHLSRNICERSTFDDIVMLDWLPPGPGLDANSISNRTNVPSIAMFNIGLNFFLDKQGLVTKDDKYPLLSTEMKGNVNLS